MMCTNSTYDGEMAGRRGFKDGGHCMESSAMFLKMWSCFTWYPHYHHTLFVQCCLANIYLDIHVIFVHCIGSLNVQLNRNVCHIFHKHVYV